MFNIFCMLLTVLYKVYDLVFYKTLIEIPVFLRWLFTTGQGPGCSGSQGPVPQQSEMNRVTSVSIVVVPSLPSPAVHILSPSTTTFHYLIWALYFLLSDPVRVNWVRFPHIFIINLAILIVNSQVIFLYNSSFLEKWKFQSFLLKWFKVMKQPAKWKGNFQELSRCCREGGLGTSQ